VEDDARTGAFTSAAAYDGSLTTQPPVAPNGAARMDQVDTVGTEKSGLAAPCAVGPSDILDEKLQGGYTYRTRPAGAPGGAAPPPTFTPGSRGAADSAVVDRLRPDTAMDERQEAGEGY
jgi:hypothetical protein